MSLICALVIKVFSSFFRRKAIAAVGLNRLYTGISTTTANIFKSHLANPILNVLHLL
jgi:hypothetical protein